MRIPPCERHVPGPAARFAARLGGRLPMIDTPRLRLRGPRIYDFDAYAGILCSDRAEYMGGPVTRAQAWAAFTNYTACWLLHGFGLWTIDAATTPSAGFVLLGFEYDDNETVPGLGVFLTEGAEGHGYAAEAAGAVRDHAFGDLALPGLVSCIAPGNARAVALMTRLGAQRDPAAGDDTWIFRHVPEAA